jgi:hypothetical protein
MRSVLEAGFIFWGLFLVFGMIVAGYLLWMYLAERDEDDTDPPPPTGVP